MATVALQPTRDCLEEWRQESQQTEEDLRESLEALDAYQRQLDAWQRRLVEDREQLEQERQRLSEQADLALAAAESNDQLAELEAELNASRQRGEELQQQLGSGDAARVELQTENARLAAESAQANQLKQQLELQLAETRAELTRQNQHWSTEFARVVKLLEEQQTAPAYVAPEPAPAPAVIAAGSSDDPVLGSVVAQFSKLRQQRAERGVR